MRRLTRTLTLPLGRLTAVKVIVHLYRSPGLIAGYYSRVRVGDTDAHILMVDLDATKPDDDAVIAAALAYAFDRALPDVWVARTDKGYHVVSTGLTDAYGYTDAYHYFADALPEGIDPDWRHLGFGLMRGVWTLRVSKRTAPDSKPVRIIAYERGEDKRVWSVAHWTLLASLPRLIEERALETPSWQRAIRVPLPVVVYKE